MEKSFVKFVKYIRTMGCNYPIHKLWEEYNVLLNNGNTANICDEALVAFSRMKG